MTVGISSDCGHYRLSSTTIFFPQHNGREVRELQNNANFAENDETTEKTPGNSLNRDNMNK